ncbi:hypothetical protein RHGRI_013227 [Rhododendron griersonianum]|uniref:DUF4283 domain-containing protein n=1 Tax=Rhododendron griersonianum TaxID=479676 RepID=A0AAV6K4R6_9ERIC|nr:hypothetical protein RHGRI_013227 [Rhododendron griersonianum]
MNGLPYVSRVHSVKLLDCLEAASSPVVPILNPAGSPCLESAKPKWTEVVASPSNTSGSTRMTLSYHPPPQRRDAKVVVCPPQEVIDLGSNLWADSVVGYFLDKRVPFPLVKNIIMRIWEKFGISDVLANDQGFFFFKFTKADAYLEVEYANGDSAFVNVTYPWKPLRCSECHIFGHSEVAVLPSEESVEQAMVNPEGFGLKSIGALGQHSHSPKLASPAVGSLPRNSVVMTDGVAFGWVGQHQGLEVKTPLAPPGSLSPPKVSSGLSNTFAILQSTVFEDEQSIPAMEMASDSPLPDECPSSSVLPLFTKRTKGNAKGKGGGGIGAPPRNKGRR